ncbi:MAG: glycosyltransferase, partial [Solirubrobacterales bacterium]
MRRILFVTSNGTGLGHLTRGMAIARHLGDDVQPSFLTLSAAAPVVEEVGFHVEYFPSHSAAAAESQRRWDRRLRTRLELLLEELSPDVLVFDGAHPYDSLVAVIRAQPPGSMRTVWCRRPMWRERHGAEAIYWAGEFDRVLEPGELAEPEDRGLTVARRAEAERVGPIVFLGDRELLGREQAVIDLGLDPARQHALLALGQGAEVDAAVERCLALLSSHPEIQVAALESSLSPKLSVPSDVVPLRGTYPMSRFNRAFDLAISAAGYNAFHELLAHGIPSLFVPMPRQIDDQPARARWAQQSGLGRGVAGPTDRSLEHRLEELLDPDTREKIATNLQD